MIRRFLQKLPRLLWFLPGFLLWASFPPMGEKLDCFFALAPILWYARRRDARRSFWTWFCNGFFFWFATLSWMPAIIRNGGPWPLVLLGWGLLAAYCALYFGLFGWLSSRLWRWIADRRYSWRLFALVVGEPLLWAGLELIRSRLFGGFAWNQLGVAPINAGFGAPAALGGVYLVSAVVILVNGTFASIAERMLTPYEGRLAALFRKPPKLTDPVDGVSAPAVYAVPRWVRSVETLVPFLLIFALYQLAGALVPAPVLATESVRFGLMQRNFPAVFKGEEDPRPAYVTMVGRLMRAQPDVLVLPESAFCEIAALDSPRADRFIEGWLARLGATAVLAGGARTDEAGCLYNSAGLYTLLGSNVVARQIYDKVHLVPFGEFIPGDKLIPALQRLAPVGSCMPGEEKLLGTTVRGEILRLAPAICYEDTDSALIRRQAARGAQALVFITNDNWFAGSTEPEQHAWQAVARAIETGLPVVRVGNSGVTGVVTPDGRARWLRGDDGRLLVDATGALAVDVHPASPGAGPRTWYGRFGDVPLSLAFLLLITTMGVIKYKHDYEKRRTVSL